MRALAIVPSLMLLALQTAAWKPDGNRGFERTIEKEVYAFSGATAANPGDVLFRIAAFAEEGAPMQLLVYWYVGQDNTGITLRRKEGFGFGSVAARYADGVNRGLTRLESLWFTSIATSHLAKVDYEEFRLPPPDTVVRVTATASTSDHLVPVAIERTRDTTLRARLIVE